MKLSALKPLEKNPFKLKGDAELDSIAKSIQSFEKMMSIRKIVIDEDNVILGGNKRFYALKQLGYKTIPDEWIDKRTDLTEAEKREFIVKDNSHWGSTWDYELLTEWQVPLSDWGLPNFSDGMDENGMSDNNVDTNEEFNPIGDGNDMYKFIVIFDTKIEIEEWIKKNIKIKLDIKKNEGGACKVWQVNMSNTYGR